MGTKYYDKVVTQSSFHLPPRHEIQSHPFVPNFVLHEGVELNGLESVYRRSSNQVTIEGRFQVISIESEAPRVSHLDFLAPTTISSSNPHILGSVHSAIDGSYIHGAINQLPINHPQGDTICILIHPGEIAIGDIIVFVVYYDA